MATQSSYFGNWEPPRQDDYCPLIVSADSSPSRPTHGRDGLLFYEADDLLPSACPRKSQGLECTMAEATYKRNTVRQSKAKRMGIAPRADSQPGKDAARRMDQLLYDTSSSTEDLLAAMYNPSWDLKSLQQWYDNSQQTPADLALYKIMYSLKYTPEEHQLPL